MYSILKFPIRFKVLHEMFLSVDKSLLKCTASQIEKITVDTVYEVTGAKGIHLKFYDMDQFFLKEAKELRRYLSLELMRRKVLLHMASRVLKYGGYLLVDGLEKEMAKDKAVTLLRLFSNPEVNLKGTCLFATTLASVLIDEMEHNDGIYLLHQDAGIQVRNLAELITRNDLKKRDVYRSGTFPGTVLLQKRYFDLI